MVKLVTIKILSFIWLNIAFEKKMTSSRYGLFKLGYTCVT